jgi:hypothetical protein
MTSHYVLWCYWGTPLTEEWPLTTWYDVTEVHHSLRNDLSLRVMMFTEVHHSLRNDLSLRVMMFTEVHHSLRDDLSLRIMMLLRYTTHWGMTSHYVLWCYWDTSLTEEWPLTTCYDVTEIHHSLRNDLSLRVMMFTEVHHSLRNDLSLRVMMLLRCITHWGMTSHYVLWCYWGTPLTEEWPLTTWYDVTEIHHSLRNDLSLRVMMLLRCITHWGMTSHYVIWCYWGMTSHYVIWCYWDTSLTKEWPLTMCYDVTEVHHSLRNNLSLRVMMLLRCITHWGITSHYVLWCYWDASFTEEWPLTTWYDVTEVHHSLRNDLSLRDMMLLRYITH